MDIQVSLTLHPREESCILLLLSSIRLRALPGNEKSSSHTKLKTYS